MTGLDCIERNSKRWEAMEKEVSDVGSMARATTLILELYQDQKLEFTKVNSCTGADLANNLSEWSDTLDFMVSHLDEMAAALKRHYK